MKSQLSHRIHATAKHGHKADLQLLLDMGAGINEKNSSAFDAIALLEAVYNGHLSYVELLIERGADATILTRNGNSVLHLAAQKSTDSEMMNFLLNDVVETRRLVDVKGSSGDTPLHQCCYSGNQSPVIRLEKAKMLIHAGATSTIKSSCNIIPYALARDWGGEELAKYLWSQLSLEQQAQESPPLA